MESLADRLTRGLSSRKVPGAHHVSAKEVRELLKLPWVRDEALSGRGWDARLLPDGRVLLFWGEGLKGNVYPSRESLEKVQREGREEQAKGPINLPMALLPPIDDFLRDVEAHARSLGARIRVPEDVLDGSEASLDAVDAALKRIRLVKRVTPEVVTPLVAYVGQVMLGVCGGRWAKAPTTRKREVPVYDPAEEAAWKALNQAAWAAAKEAAAEVKARRGSAAAQSQALHGVMGQLIGRGPKPIRVDSIDEPISGQENTPMIRARDGRLLDPFARVVIPMVEPSKRISLRAGVDVTLLPYRAGLPA
jgi:hypothetical protein